MKVAKLYKHAGGEQINEVASRPLYFGLQKF